MTESTKKTIRIAYYALICVALVAAAVLLMTACVNIYRLGDYPFTRALVAEKLSEIAIPLYACLGLAVVGFVLHPLLPPSTDSDKDRNRMTVRRLRRITDLNLCPTDLADTIRKEQAAQKRRQRITVALFAVGLAVMLWYALSFQRFSMEDINGSFVSFGLVMVPCLGIPAGYGVYALYAARDSYQLEIALLRSAPKEAKHFAEGNTAFASENAAAVIDNRQKWNRVARYAILAAAIGLIVGGYLAGGWVDVLTKAINICTECVGLG